MQLFSVLIAKQSCMSLGIIVFIHCEYQILSLGPHPSPMFHTVSGSLIHSASPQAQFPSVYTKQETDNPCSQIADHLNKVENYL